MARGSLDKHLSNFDLLNPHMRVGVAHDVSRALEVMHTGSDRVVVHRDVKRFDRRVAKLPYTVLIIVPSPQCQHSPD